MFCPFVSTKRKNGEPIWLKFHVATWKIYSWSNLNNVGAISILANYNDKIAI